MKPSSIRFMDVADESASTRAPRLAPADDRVMRERCDVSSFDPPDPRDNPAPAEQVFKRQGGKEAGGESTKKRNAADAEGSVLADEGQADAGQAPGTGEVAIGSAAGAEGASLKISLQAQIDIFEMLRSGRTNVMQMALQTLQNNFRWNGTLRLESPDADSGAPATGRLTAEVLDTSPESKAAGGKGKLAHLLTLDASSQSSRLTEQLRQAAIWLSSIASATRQVYYIIKDLECPKI